VPKERKMKKAQRERDFKDYVEKRGRGEKRIALTWEEIVYEVTSALGTGRRVNEDGELEVGENDTQHWLDGMKDILEDPFFEKDPVPVPIFEVATNRMKKINPAVIGHTWASPHPEAWHKLGRFQVWTPEGEIIEADENGVRNHLMENRIKRAKL
jgi:hypothetical protein